MAMTAITEHPDHVDPTAVMNAYQFEVYSDYLVMRGVCSNAPVEEVVRWMNATSKSRWAPAVGATFYPSKEEWPAPCPEPGKGETHTHYLLRSGA